MILLTFSEIHDEMVEHCAWFDTEEAAFTVWRHLSNCAVQDGTTPQKIRIFIIVDHDPIEVDPRIGLPLRPPHR